MTLSKHLIYERTERLEYLQEYFGYSDKVLLETVDREKSARIQILSTGVCYIIDLYKDYIITAYALDVSRAAGIWYNATGKRMPQQLYKRVKKNMERHPEVFKMKQRGSTMKHEWMWHLFIGLILFFGWGGCFLLLYLVGGGII